MQLTIEVNDTDISDSALLEATRISKEISGRVSTAEFTFMVEDQSDLARYDTATYDNATYGVDIRELYEIVAKDGSAVKQFAGFITKVGYERLADGVVQMVASCNDYTILLERTIVPEATFTGQSDRAIIQSLITTYCPQLTALTANIALLEASIGYFEVKEKTLRQALEELCAYTGGEWRVDYEKAVKYFSAGTYAAPFGLSTAPNGTTTFEYEFSGYERDFIRPINRVTVLGGFLPGGVEISVTYDDPVSILEYGLHATTIIDREITLAADALLKAQVMVQQNAYPLEAGKLKFWTDGIDVGQSLGLFHDLFNVSGSYLVRSMNLSWTDKTRTEYEIEVGADRPSMERLIRQMEARARQGTTQTPVALPTPGSVSDVSIDSGGLTAAVIGSVNASVILGQIIAGQIGTVNATSITGTITSTQIGSVNATAILGLIAAAQIGTVNAGVIQGAIVAGQIGSVNAGVIQGAIISSQVADELIDRLAMFSEPLRWIPDLAADPTLPDTNYPLDSFYRRTTDGQFRQNVAGTWTNVTEAAAISGKLAFYSIGTIKAGSIIGLIAAAQIGSITAGQITGAITASQIASVNTSAFVGSITASQISTVNASAIQGSITSSQIGSVAATTITGTIVSSQIGSVAATTITGSITSSQIGSVAASTITGSITSSQIGSVSASAITGTITSGQIASVNASAISGTISSTQIGSINAATITIGLVQGTQINTISASQLTAGTVTATVSLSSASLYLNLSGATTTINNASAGGGSFGAAYGIVVSNNSTGRQATVSDGRIGLLYNSSTTAVSIYADNGGPSSGGTIALNDTGGSTTISMFGAGGDIIASGDVQGAGFFVSGTQVVGSRKSSVSDPSGGATVDSEARTAISTIISRLQSHGLIS